MFSRAKFLLRSTRRFTGDYCSITVMLDGPPTNPRRNYVAYVGDRKNTAASRLTTGHRLSDVTTHVVRKHNASQSIPAIMSFALASSPAAWSAATTQTMGCSLAIYGPHGLYYKQGRIRTTFDTSENTVLRGSLPLLLKDR